ncbi:MULTISPECIES: acetyl-CoA C-acyltransferase [Caldilinea]|jgi:acetyl-CoA acyltransferase|uniref:acetyl-CoA C-acyltransferase n=2 Tax=Caldilinea aerophila TaxID=133453 RepID=I0I1H3_CALAS|nr:MULTISPECIES: acetyl-CoA C-acyltransferase [Caldilinea]MBO9393747.1 acetyl-CoA C-acyltransferase [Caldilinea sp.]BAL99110.1 acetyl-CoA C-acyltransferase [Caldilinea aerophila DSM 14535 = NBRC 104270]GIV74298.1 MAG: acetyl-CoA acetyltransferase [Caldilinea sp.]
MRNAVIVAAARTAVGKAPKGTLRTTRPDEMAATVIKAVIERAGIDKNEIEDVVIGCAFPEAEQGMNVARIASLRAGLPVTAAGQTVNRFCSSGLQTIATAAQQIMAGMGDVIIAGGVESMSMVPMVGNKFVPNPYLASEYPGVYLGMGLTAENVARQYEISREEQDAFALRSHQRAAAAQDAGKFDAEIVPLDVHIKYGEGSEVKEFHTIFTRDEGVRRDTSMEALAKLKPVFAANGTVTAGNSSQTSDGAAAVLLMSEEKARALGMKPLARFVSFAVGGVPPEVMGIGPVAAVPKALKYAGMELKEIDLIELNEAFAAQALAVIRELNMDEEKVNVNGGAIALGHPLGCTGAKLTVQLIHELQRQGKEFGLVTMCIGGGMGAAGIIQMLN